MVNRKSPKAPKAPKAASAAVPAAPAAPPAGPATCGGFVALPLRLRSPRGRALTRVLYARAHASAAEERAVLEPERTVLVANAPPRAGAALVSGVMGAAGAVASVLPCPEAWGAHYVVFASAQAARRALEIRPEDYDGAEEPPYDNVLEQWRSAAIRRQQRAKDPQAMLDEADEFVRAFAQRREERRAEEDTKASAPDADGFILVARRRGHKKATDGAIHVAAARRSAARLDAERRAKEAKQQQQQVLLDFYAFQRREAKKDELVRLRRRFEADKKRLQRMKANRKFKPV
eukprot:m51a1_g14566 hypothetical protein (290) ;mRNA; f:1057983-1059389